MNDTNDDKLIFKAEIKDGKLAVTFGKHNFQCIAYALKLVEMQFENMILGSQPKPMKPKVNIPNITSDLLKRMRG